MSDFVAPPTAVTWRELCAGMWRAQDSCCGEIVHSPGKIPRMAPLQRFYTDILDSRQAAIATTARSTYFASR